MVGLSQRGALVMAHGTPARPEELEAFYTEIRRGRPPEPEQLADLRRRYDAIGGLSPLTERTMAQIEGIRAALGAGWIVELGQKFASPRIEDGARALVDAGASEVVGVVLAPHHSALSTDQYHERLLAVVPSARTVGPWGVHPVLVELLLERVAEGGAELDPTGATRAIEVIVTAHSLPARCLEVDEQPNYADQLAATAASLGGRVAWQSAGRTPDPWLGPDLLEVLRSLPSEGVDGVVVCPAGFTADHLEVLYDVDIEAAAVATQVGLELRRTRSLNDDPRFCALIADLIRAA